MKQIDINRALNTYRDIRYGKPLQNHFLSSPRFRKIMLSNRSIPVVEEKKIEFAKDILGRPSIRKDYL